MDMINRSEDYKGHVNRVMADDTTVMIQYCYRGNVVYDEIEYTRSEALNMARSIIEYYGER